MAGIWMMAEEVGIQQKKRLPLTSNPWSPHCPWQTDLLSAEYMHTCVPLTRVTAEQQTFSTILGHSLAAAMTEARNNQNYECHVHLGNLVVTSQNK